MNSNYDDDDSGTMDWPRIQKAASLVFHVWTENEYEMAWIKMVWDRYTARGLTKYGDDGEKYMVALRFAFLAEFYNQFVRSAWDEDTQVLDGDIANEFCVGLVHLRAFVGQHAESFDRDDLLAILDFTEDSEAQCYLDPYFVQRFWVDCTAELATCFESKNTLFTSLWRTHPEHHREETACILGEPSDEKMSAYGWMTEYY